MTAICQTDMESLDEALTLVTTLINDLGAKICNPNWTMTDAYIIDQLDEARYRLERAYRYACMTYPDDTGGRE